MKPVPDPLLKMLLGLYKPEYRYLQKAEVEYPSAKGEFNCGKTAYTIFPLEHMTAVEALLGINQLTFAAFATWMLEKKMPFLPMSFDDYLHLMKENAFIISQRMRYLKPISTSQPIQGMIELVAIVPKNEYLYLAGIDCSFEEGKFVGGLELALKLPQKTPPLPAKS